MKKILLWMFFGLLYGLLYGEISAQNSVKGIVIDSDSETPIENVIVRFTTEPIQIKTTVNGAFILKNNANGTYILELKFEGYELQRFPIIFTGASIDLGSMLFYKINPVHTDSSTIMLRDDELNAQTTDTDNISGLLQASKDVYLKTAAYEFSASFFKVKGLGSENGTVLINGIELNKIYNGRPQWSNWGGLNTVFQNQEFTPGLSPSSYTFGRVLGVTNYNIRPSEASVGTKISYASSNRSYAHRMLVSYASGLLKKGWAFTVAFSKRAAEEGFSDGTFYNASSFFVGIEKKLNDHHSLNFSAIIASNERGKSSANTQEVYDLKGRTYNSYWGFQKGRIRNSRVKKIAEPILMLNHYWDVSATATLQTAIAYQFGTIGNSRIAYNGSKIDGAIDNIPTLVSLGGSNPDPTYYQKLPSYALRAHSSDVYEIAQHFIENGQVDWGAIYQGNQNSLNNGNAAYMLYEDRNDDQQFTIHSMFETALTEHLLINASVQWKHLKSENFANVLDLLGGSGFLDIDHFGSDYHQKQNNVLTPNRMVTAGDHFKYKYTIAANSVTSFLQTQFSYKKFDAFIAGSFSKSLYQRNGQYQNGKFATQNESLGSSKLIEFTNFGFKSGGTYKITGRHFINANMAHLTKAPTVQNSFPNSRISNAVVEHLTSEKITSLDLSYVLRAPIFQAKITGYFTKIRDATAVSFYYADGIGGSGSEYTAFVQEILSNIDKKHFGIEIGISAQITSALTLKAAVNIGQYTYDNNPNLALTSEAENFQFTTRLAHLKNYKLSSGPQKACAIGFEYRAPEYWWMGATLNFFDDIYFGINPLTRTTNFSDDGGIPFNEYDPVVAKRLLQQEKFKSYAVLNIVGGKTWKIKNKYVGFFASIQNVLNTEYKTGGFEQGRNANYRELLNDKALKIPVFGNKYWYGRGTTYFLNIHIRF